jgi:hypothetical protein
MPRPRGNNVKPSFGLTFIGSAVDQDLTAHLKDSPYYPQRVHLIDVGTYVLEFEAVPSVGGANHTLTVTLTTDNLPLTLNVPVKRLMAGTTNDAQLVAEY